MSRSKRARSGQQVFPAVGKELGNWLVGGVSIEERALRGSVEGFEGTPILVECRVCGGEAGDSWERGLPLDDGSNVGVRVEVVTGGSEVLGEERGKGRRTGERGCRDPLKRIFAPWEVGMGGGELGPMVSGD